MMRSNPVQVENIGWVYSIQEWWRGCWCMRLQWRWSGIGWGCRDVIMPCSLSPPLAPPCPRPPAPRPPWPQSACGGRRTPPPECRPAPRWWRECPGCRKILTGAVDKWGRGQKRKEEWMAKERCRRRMNLKDSIDETREEKAKKKR